MRLVPDTFPTEPMHPHLLFGIVPSLLMYLHPFVFELFRRVKAFCLVMPICHNTKAYTFLSFDNKDVPESLEFVARLAILPCATCGDLTALDYSLFEVWPEWYLDSQNAAMTKRANPIRLAVPTPANAVKKNPVKIRCSKGENSILRSSPTLCVIFILFFPFVYSH